MTQKEPSSDARCIVSELERFQDQIVQTYGTVAETIAGLWHLSKTLEEGVTAAVEREQDPGRIAFFVGQGDLNEVDSRAQYSRTFYEVIASCEVGGVNEKMLQDFSVVLICTIWENEVRPKLASLSNTALNEIKCQAFADLQALRNGLLHKSSFLRKELKFFDIFEKDERIDFDRDILYLLFRGLFYSISDLAANIGVTLRCRDFDFRVI